jgi:hypothetical protein
MVWFQDCSCGPLVMLNLPYLEGGTSYSQTGGVPLRIGFGPRSPVWVQPSTGIWTDFHGA